MNIKTILLAMLCSCTFNLAYADNTTWTWATEATYPPFESTTDDGKVVGFDADLMQAICKNLNHKCTLVNAPFASLIPSLNIGKYDAIIGGLAITKAREKVIYFSQPYYQDSVIFVFPESSKNTTIAKQTIGVQAGTSYQAFLQKFYPQVHIKTYASNIDGLMDLTAGRIDAVLIDRPVFMVWQQSSSSTHKFMQVNAANTQQQKEVLGLYGNGIGIAKGNKAMLANINTAITDLKNNGTLLKLQKKWFKDA
jgi:arginine transport system substrate-binding protein